MPQKFWKHQAVENKNVIFLSHYAHSVLSQQFHLSNIFTLYLHFSAIVKALLQKNLLWCLHY